MKNKKRGFTTTNEGQNENLFSFSPNAVGGNTRSGFTLIELLVVISIISLLSSIVLAAVQDARGKARDSKRVSELQELAKALQLYSQDNGGYYPLGDLFFEDPNDPNDLHAFLESYLVPKYISKIPDGLRMYSSINLDSSQTDKGFDLVGVFETNYNSNLSCSKNGNFIAEIGIGSNYCEMQGALSYEDGKAVLDKGKIFVLQFR